MSFIKLQNVSVEFPVYNVNSQSFKQKVLNVATGGKIAKNSTGIITVQALTNITLNIQAGDKIALLGHNGAGKTTLLRLLNGVYIPTSGSFEKTGTTGSLIDIFLGTNQEATGYENIQLRAMILGIDRKSLDKYMDGIIEFADIGSFLDMPMYTYSSGMKMRLAFAVSTIKHYDILLMDEWLGVGDINFKHKAKDRLGNVVENADILVIATHSKNTALSNCNKAIWLEHGEIKMQGAIQDVCDSYFG